jgi:hypothetical protein
MKITISVDTGNGPETVTTNLFTVITWERKYKRRAGDLAAGIGAEDLAFLAQKRLSTSKSLARRTKTLRSRQLQPRPSGAAGSHRILAP